MVKSGVKTIGFIGFKDPYGENWHQVFSAAGREGAASRSSPTEYYQRTDPSVTGQALKLIAAKPDAVLIAGVGGPAVLPQITLRDQGYKGTVYQTHGVATDDFIRLGKDKVEGTVLAAGPMLVVDEIPDANPIKKVALNYIALYESEVRPEARDVRRQHVGLGDHPAAGDSRCAQGGQARNGRVSLGAARRDRAGARDRRLPGRVQHVAREPQRDGRARACARDREGRQVQAAGRVKVARSSARPHRRPAARRGPRHALRRRQAACSAGIRGSPGRAGRRRRAASPSSRGARGRRRGSRRRPCARGGTRRERRAHRALRECRRRHGREPRLRRARDSGRAGLARRARRHAVDRAGDDRAGRRGGRGRRRRRRAISSAASAAIRSDSAQRAPQELAALTGDEGAKSVVARSGIVSSASTSTTRASCATSTRRRIWQANRRRTKRQNGREWFAKMLTVNRGHADRPFRRT